MSCGKCGAEGQIIGLDKVGVDGVRTKLCVDCAATVIRELGTFVSQHDPEMGRQIRRFFGIGRRRAYFAGSIPDEKQLAIWGQMANDLNGAGVRDLAPEARVAIFSLIAEVRRVRKILGTREKQLMTKIQAWKAFRMGIIASGAQIPEGDHPPAQRFWAKMRDRFMQWFADYLSQGQPPPFNPPHPAGAGETPATEDR